MPDHRHSCRIGKNAAILLFSTEGRRPFRLAGPLLEATLTASSDELLSSEASSLLSASACCISVDEVRMRTFSPDLFPKPLGPAEYREHPEVEGSEEQVDVVVAPLSRRVALLLVPFWSAASVECSRCRL